MAEAAQMFLFLYKSKYRRKAAANRPSHHSAAGADSSSSSKEDEDEERTHRRHGTARRRRAGGGGGVYSAFWSLVVWTTLLQCAAPLETAAASSPTNSLAGANASACDLESCLNGNCVNGSCICREGWQGPNCQYCASKVRWVWSERNVSCDAFLAFSLQRVWVVLAASAIINCVIIWLC